MNMTEEVAKQKYCPFRQDTCCASACMMWNTKKVLKISRNWNRTIEEVSFCSIANVYNTTIEVI